MHNSLYYYFVIFNQIVSGWCLVDVSTMKSQCIHMDVGVRELKQHLSEYLERAANGEVIRVTDRGQPKALLCPVPGQHGLKEGMLAGWIRAPRESEPQPVVRVPARATISDVLSEDRGE
jgi:prevent-host-death family protein